MRPNKGCNRVNNRRKEAKTRQARGESGDRMKNRLTGGGGSRKGEGSGEGEGGGGRGKGGEGEGERG